MVCRHVAEHVPDVMAFVTELYRITRPGGRISITTPHYSNPDWPTDPTHRNHFNSYSFNCFIEERQVFPFYTEVKLKPIRVYVSLANLWRAFGLELIVNLGSALAGASIHAQVLGVLSKLRLSRQGTTIRV